MRYNVDKYIDYLVMNIAQFNNLFQLYPMLIIPGSLSTYYRSFPTTFKIREKHNLISGVGVGENRATHDPITYLTDALNSYK